MAENSGAEKRSSTIREILRNRRADWWTSGAVVLVALVGVTWLGRKRIHFSFPYGLISHPPDWFLPLGIGAGVLLAIAILWKLPQWQVGHVKRLDGKERFDRVNEARKTLATILGGAAILAGGYVTWQNLALAREGQIADRFSKAIEQLGAVNSDGSKKLEVRLGGIYALEGIAYESERDHWPIMEALCSYVRLYAPLKHEVELVPPAPDIQAILTVLGRRDRKNENENQRLNLNYIDIHAASLEGADLAGATFEGASLEGAYLNGANLNGADLLTTNLDAADLRKAHLIGAQLTGAHLSQTTLFESDFTGAILNQADLSFAILDMANLHGTFLHGTNLSGTILRKTDFRKTEGLTQEQADEATGDSTVQLPDNLHKPEGWRK
jgi:uncharacterized protein YjbI with pentapeptide repeats